MNISSQTEDDIDRIKKEAYELLTQFLNDMLEEERPRIIADAMDELGTGFWPSVWASVTGAMFYSLILLMLYFTIEFFGFDLLTFFQ